MFSTRDHRRVGTNTQSASSFTIALRFPVIDGPVAIGDRLVRVQPIVGASLCIREPMNDGPFSWFIRLFRGRLVGFSGRNAHRLGIRRHAFDDFDLIVDAFQ